MYNRNVHVLKSIVETVVFCGKQNLSLRGDRDDRTSTSSNRDDRSSTSSNRGHFWAVLEKMAKRDDTLREHIESGRKNAQYTSRVILNEVIGVVI